MEIEIKSMFIKKKLFCPMISSWITIPLSFCFNSSLYYILSLSDIIYNFITFIFAISFSISTFFITISYYRNKLNLYYISYYISLIFFILLIIFFTLFFLSSIIFITFTLPDIKIFSTLIDMIFVLLPSGILFIMLINIISFKKKINVINSEETQKLNIEINSNKKIKKKKKKVKEKKKRIY